MTHATPTDATEHPKRPYLPHLIRILSIPIVVFWVFVAVIVNVIAPPLEVVGESGWLVSQIGGYDDGPGSQCFRVLCDLVELRL